MARSEQGFGPDTDRNTDTGIWWFAAGVSAAKTVYGTCCMSMRTRAEVSGRSPVLATVAVMVPGGQDAPKNPKKQMFATAQPPSAARLACGPNCPELIPVSTGCTGAVSTWTMAGRAEPPLRRGQSATRPARWRMALRPDSCRVTPVTSGTPDTAGSHALGKSSGPAPTPLPHPLGTPPTTRTSGSEMTSA